MVSLSNKDVGIPKTGIVPGDLKGQDVDGERKEKKKTDYESSFEWWSHHSVLERIGVVFVFKYCIRWKVQDSTQRVPNSIGGGLITGDPVPNRNYVLLCNKEDI